MAKAAKKREVVAEVMLRLTEEDFGALVAVQMPGESRAAAYLRVMRDAVVPATVKLRYRKAPLFPNWLGLTTAPVGATTALMRMEVLKRGGWEVEYDEVEPPPPTPLHPDDLAEDDDEEEDE